MCGSVCWLGVVLVTTGFARPARAYYDPAAQRWINRDPLGEQGGRNLFGFVGNGPMARVDSDGRGWTDPDGGHWPRPLPPGDGPTAPEDNHAPPIDCSGYDQQGGAECYSCAGLGPKVKDTYPEKAKKVCEGFAAQYTGTPHQRAVACVAACLIKAETACQYLPNCSDRNCCRIMAHFGCYGYCGFVPDRNLPAGGWQVGLIDLLPSALLSPMCQRLGVPRL
jgi:hypothetical protein